MFRMFLLMLLSITSIIASAETESTTRSQGFVTDNLYIYLHSGPSTQYRIIGSVYAGDSIIKLSESDDGKFIQIEDKKQRVGWIDSKYFTSDQSLKAQLLTLQDSIQTYQTDIATLQEENQQLSAKLEAAQQASQSQSSGLLSENKQLKADLALLMEERKQGADAFRTQQRDMQNERMLYGAGILLAGLIIGRIFGSFKRRSSFLE